MLRMQPFIFAVLTCKIDEDVEVGYWCLAANSAFWDLAPGKMALHEKPYHLPVHKQWRCNTIAGATYIRVACIV